MAQLPDELLDLLRDPAAVKILATTGADGAPHVALRPTLHLLDNGDLAFAEELDSSATSKNLVRAIWSDRSVAVGISRGDRTWELRAKPWRCLVAGPLFKRFLLEARAAQGGDADVSTVWVIRPDSASDQSPATRRAQDAARRPYGGSHLDRESLVRRGA